MNTPESNAVEELVKEGRRTALVSCVCEDDTISFHYDGASDDEASFVNLMRSVAVVVHTAKTAVLKAGMSENEFWFNLREQVDGINIKQQKLEITESEAPKKKASGKVVPFPTR